MNILNTQRTVIATCIAAAISGSAYAQDSSNESTNTTKEDKGIERIVISSTKRMESVQEVPIAIKSMSGDELRQLGITKASDITKVAPNMTISGQSSINRQINIRGVGTNDFFGNSSGAVGVYMDEVTMSAPYLSGLGLYDMERVEVLRGPQNSLFGRNTTGGAVNYISSKPTLDEEYDGYVDLNIGNFGLTDLQAASNFSISENVAIRVAGMVYKRDGIWNNLAENGDDFGEKDRHSLRATLLWEPSSDTEILLNFHTAREDSEFDPVKSIGIRGENGVPTQPLAGTQFDFGKQYKGFNAQGDDPSTKNWSDVYVTGTHLNDIEADGAYLKINHDMGFATFTSITSYDETNVLWSYEMGGIGNKTPSTVSALYGSNTPQVALAIDQDQYFEQISQELRLVSNGDGDFRWIAGIYLFKENADLMQNIRSGEFTSPADNGFAPLGGNLAMWSLIQHGSVSEEDFPNTLGYGNTLSYSYAEMENTVWSPYVHMDYNLTEKTTVTLGLRYTNDTKKLSYNEVGQISTKGDSITHVYDKEEVLSRAANNTLVCDLDGDGNTVNITPGATGDNMGKLCTQELDRDDVNTKEWGGKLGLDHKLAEDILLFGSYSRGFRAGKHDIEFYHGPHTGFIIQDLGDETLDAFELGIKTDLFENSLRFNVSSYYYLWKNQQTLFVHPEFGPAFANIPESELYGLEVEFIWAPGDDWLVQGGLGLQSTEITEASGSINDEEGHELPFASDTSFNLMVVKDVFFAESQLTFQADYQYSAAPKAYAKTVDYVDELDEVNRLNARVTYVFGDDAQYEMALWGQNLTGNETCSYKWDLFALSGTSYCVANEAETMYGLSGRVSF